MARHVEVVVQEVEQHAELARGLGRGAAPPPTRVKDVEDYALACMKMRDLKREKKLISQSQDIAHLRKMADAE